MRFSHLGWFLFGCALFIVSSSSGAKKCQCQCRDELCCKPREECHSLKMCRPPRNSTKGRDRSILPDIDDVGNELHNKYMIDTAEESIYRSAEFERNGSCVQRCCLNGTARLPRCQNVSDITCDETYPYRSYDGSCNNLQNPHLGQAGSCHQRMLPPDYDDGVGSPRTENNMLPNPREICIKVHRVSEESCNIPDKKLSAFFMGFGQCVDHDLTLTAVVTGPNNTPLQCCSPNATSNPDCFPIIIPPCDPDFKNLTCMNFARSRACQSCNESTTREQTNVLTSFLDCSHVYGVTEDQANSLRNQTDTAKLKEGNQTGLPPSNNQTCGPCACFLTGDVRANQNPALTLCQVTLFRLHNNIVDFFREQHPDWNNEKLYQETRKLACAIFVAIIYKEYLPLLVGKGDDCNTRLYDDNTEYDQTQDPRTVNEVMGAAFRLHTSVPNLFTCNNMCGIPPLAANFFVNTLCRLGVPQCSAEQIPRQPQAASDRFLDSSVTKFLYLRSNSTRPQLDLCSVNIQRGRDQGIPSYTSYVKHCFCREIKSFDDLKDLICPKCLEKYKGLYSNPEDIDLWSALQCEKRIPGIPLGPVAMCLIRHQFHVTKYGDRFFLTHKGVFNETQRRCINSFSLAAVFCLTYPEMKVVQSNPFITDSCTVKCDDLLATVKKECQWS